jgi:hypothetical protein
MDQHRKNEADPHCHRLQQGQSRTNMGNNGTAAMRQYTNGCAILQWAVIMAPQPLNTFACPASDGSVLNTHRASQKQSNVNSTERITAMMQLSLAAANIMESVEEHKILGLRVFYFNVTILI